MPDDLKIENECNKEPWDKLLGNGAVPSVISARPPVGLHTRRNKSESSLLGSFHRTLRLSVGSKDSPNGLALHR